jgi:predicted metal-dependent hydrolase
MKASDIDLKVRKVNFKFHPNPRHWMNGNPIATHFNNAMHMVFPDGEKFFIRSVKAYYKDIKDPKLKKQIDGFVGQEGTHYKEHQKFWSILEEQGFEPEVFLKIYRKTAWDFLEKRLLKAFGDDYGKKLALSVTVALEHYTAMFAESAFTNVPNFDLPDDMRELMLWHAAEEIEHKAIPFNLLKEVDDSYLLRVNGMIIATLGLSFYIALGQMILMSQDKEMELKSLPGHFMAFIKGISGGMGNTLTKHYFKYFQPDFHPDDIENYHLAEAYFASRKEQYSA